MALLGGEEERYLPLLGIEPQYPGSQTRSFVSTLSYFGFYIDFNGKEI